MMLLVECEELPVVSETSSSNNIRTEGVYESSYWPDFMAQKKANRKNTAANKLKPISKKMALIIYRISLWVKNATTNRFRT